MNMYEKCFAVGQTRMHGLTFINMITLTLHPGSMTIYGIYRVDIEVRSYGATTQLPTVDGPVGTKWLPVK